MREHPILGLLAAQFGAPGKGRRLACRMARHRPQDPRRRPAGAGALDARGTRAFLLLLGAEPDRAAGSVDNIDAGLLLVGALLLALRLAHAVGEAGRAGGELLRGIEYLRFQLRIGRRPSLGEQNIDTALRYCLLLNAGHDRRQPGSEQIHVARPRRRAHHAAVRTHSYPRKALAQALRDGARLFVLAIGHGAGNRALRIDQLRGHDVDGFVFGADRVGKLDPLLDRLADRLAGVVTAVNSDKRFAERPGRRQRLEADIGRIEDTQSGLGQAIRRRFPRRIACRHAGHEGNRGALREADANLACAGAGPLPRRRGRRIRARCHGALRRGDRIARSALSRSRPGRIGASDCCVARRRAGWRLRSVGLRGRRLAARHRPRRIGRRLALLAGARFLADRFKILARGFRAGLFADAALRLVEFLDRLVGFGNLLALALDRIRALAVHRLGERIGRSRPAQVLLHPLAHEIGDLAACGQGAFGLEHFRVGLGEEIIDILHLLVRRVAGIGDAGLVWVPIFLADAVDRLPERIVRILDAGGFARLAETLRRRLDGFEHLGLIHRFRVRGGVAEVFARVDELLLVVEILPDRIAEAVRIAGGLQATFGRPCIRVLHLDLEAFRRVAGLPQRRVRRLVDDLVRMVDHLVTGGLPVLREPVRGRVGIGFEIDIGAHVPGIAAGILDLSLVLLESLVQRIATTFVEREIFVFERLGAASVILDIAVVVLPQRHEFGFQLLAQRAHVLRLVCGEQDARRAGQPRCDKSESRKYHHWSACAPMRGQDADGLHDGVCHGTPSLLLNGKMRRRCGAAMCDACTGEMVNPRCIGLPTKGKMHLQL